MNTQTQKVWDFSADRLFKVLDKGKNTIRPSALLHAAFFHESSSPGLPTSDSPPTNQHNQYIQIKNSSILKSLYVHLLL